jgi:hypothetical protein
LRHDVLARQMVRQRFALWLRLGRIARRLGWRLGFGAGGVRGVAGFQLLKPQLELLDLAGDPLR